MIYVQPMCYMCVIYVLRMCYLCATYVQPMCYPCVTYVLFMCHESAAHMLLIMCRATYVLLMCYFCSTYSQSLRAIHRAESRRSCKVRGNARMYRLHPKLLDARPNHPRVAPIPSHITHLAALPLSVLAAVGSLQHIPSYVIPCVRILRSN